MDNGADKREVMKGKGKQVRKYQMNKRYVHQRGPWLNPSNTQYEKEKRIRVIYAEMIALVEGTEGLEQMEQAFMTS